MEETKQENQETAEEPAQSPPVEKVTEKVKDPKKVRKAKEEKRLLEQLRVAKESFRPPAGDDTSANIPPKEAAAVSQTERREGLDPVGRWGLFCGRGARVSPKRANEKTRVGSPR